jgi:hypothetical protein
MRPDVGGAALEILATATLGKVEQLGVLLRIYVRLRFNQKVGKCFNREWDFPMMDITHRKVSKARLQARGKRRTKLGDPTLNFCK